jgi:hypothetical protein
MVFPVVRFMFSCLAYPLENGTFVRLIVRTDCRATGVSDSVDSDEAARPNPDP